MSRRDQKRKLYYKTEEEIELIRESSLLVSKTLATVASYIKPGIPSLKLDEVAYEFIKDNNAEAGFLNYRGFPNTLCISKNDAVVHGIPDNVALKEGDILSIDCGVFKNGFFGDSAYTFKVGKVSKEIDRLLTVTKECLQLAIDNAIAGKRVGDISFAVQNHAERVNKYGVVRELVGHGVGKELHENPDVPNFGKRGRGIMLKEGLVIAIEPMINMGKRNVVTDEDGWTIRSKDGLPSAHFEHILVVKKEKADILSDFGVIEEAISKNTELSEVI